MNAHEVVETPFTYEEFREVADSISQYWGIFYKAWAIGNAYFTTDPELPTAAMSFDKVGREMKYTFNKAFWESLSTDQKVFVVCHETLHALLKHGTRINNIPDVNGMLANMAADIPINHTVLEMMNIPRELIDPELKYCWADTVFKEAGMRVSDDRCFEDYYALLVQKFPQNKAFKFKLVDSHGEGFGEEISEDDLDEFVDEIAKDATEQEKKCIAESLKNEIQKAKELEKPNKLAGKGEGGISKILAPRKVFKKRKWESVIKNWARKATDFNYSDTWVGDKRNYAALPRDVFLPNVLEEDKKNNKRIKVWFFQDTSGSCQGFIDRFFNAAASLPEDRFEIVMHCFDTRCYPTDLKSRKLYRFGGTSYTCIDRYVEEKCKMGAKYPDAVFVITDGYGDAVKPRMPEKWFWFLSEDVRNCIPKECNIYALKDFE